MIRITHQREKCIGCNLCVEVARNRWRMSRKDGKSTIVGGEDNKGFYSVLVGDDEWKVNKYAADNCPVKIIKLEKV